MTIHIDQKILSVSVVDRKEIVQENSETISKQSMHEKVPRPAKLKGSTYRLKTPLSDHAFFITINDLILNEGTDFEHSRPFEIFINSKNMDNFQWIVAMTRVLSAVFRKGGDIAFIIEELKSVYDPKGGYFYKGAYIPSLVSAIGGVVEEHLISLGLINKEKDTHMEDFIQKKKLEYSESQNTETTSYPPEATLCPKCNHKAVITQQGCTMCLNCGDSKCG